MILHIAGRVFDSDEVKELTIREERREVFVTTEDDFYRIKYRSREDIEDVYFWKRMDKITVKDVHNAMYILTIVCEFFINSKEQCQQCPLKKNNQCMLMTIPNNWR
jgi:hypothetical protein